MAILGQEIAMDSLPDLIHVREIVARREADDPEHRWLWEIRHKVLNWTIATLERQAGPAGIARSDRLTEAAEAREQHPLLQLPTTVGMPAYQPDAKWRKAIVSRVERFMAAVRLRN